MHLAERRPARLVAVPALAHQVVDLLRAARRRRQVALHAVAAAIVAAVLDDALVAEVRERLLPAEGEDLPERHRKRPHVTLTRELALKQTVKGDGISERQAVNCGETKVSERNIDGRWTMDNGRWTP